MSVFAKGFLSSTINFLTMLNASIAVLETTSNSIKEDESPFPNSSNKASYNVSPFINRTKKNNATGGLPTCVPCLHEHAAPLWRDLPKIQRRAHMEKGNLLRAQFAGIDRAIQHAIIHNVCFSFAHNGSGVTLVIEGSKQDTAAGNGEDELCRDGVLQVCVPSYAFGDPSPMCPRIACRVGMRETAYKSAQMFEATEMVSIVSAHMRPWGWHSLLDKFMSYWNTWTCPPGESCMSNEACPRHRDILFVDDLQFCDSLDTLHPASLLVRGALGRNGKLVRRIRGESLCYRTAEIGAVPVLEPKYGDLMLARPQLFLSLARCIYSQVEAQSPNAGTGKPRVVFLNREAEFGPRRIVNLEALANELNQSWSMEKEYSIEYVDGLINLGDGYHNVL